MSPIPGWLCGAQHVALNFQSDIDLAVQLHFALFDGSGGFVLKPKEMRRIKTDLPPSQSEPCYPFKMLRRNPSSCEGLADREADYDVFNNEDHYWPLQHELDDHLYRATIQVVSLHNLPKVPRSSLMCKEHPFLTVCNHLPPYSAARSGPDTTASTKRLTSITMMSSAECTFRRISCLRVAHQSTCLCIL